MAGVPPFFVGVWRRDLLSSPAGEDRSTRVFWLQTDGLYADLRVPAERPDFSQAASLADCNAAQLDWLAGQQGFAGTLPVQGDRFHWHRALDFQPDSSVLDVGRMTVRDGYLLETGVFAPFHEHWYRITPEQPDFSAHVLERVTDGAGRAQPWRGYLLTVDGCFMLALDRRGPLPPAASLQALARGDRERLRQVLDMEISFGLLDGPQGPWQITLSTHPFREGRTLFDTPARPARRGGLQQQDDGQVLQWAPGLAAGS